MSRRVRTDLQSRDFHCPCSRSYLSYSALHTHIKKYHKKEENMLERAIIPQRDQHRRGRPKDKQPTYISEELEELTHYQTAILGVFKELQPVADAPIMLQGNEEFDIQAVDQAYEQLLQHETLNFCDLASAKTVRQCEDAIREPFLGLAKHFAVRVAARIKLMLAVGYLEFYLNSAPKEECMASMQICGWRGASTKMAELLYDVMMRALQRQPHHCELLLTSNEE